MFLKELAQHWHKSSVMAAGVSYAKRTLERGRNGPMENVSEAVELLLVEEVAKLLRGMQAIRLATGTRQRGEHQRHCAGRT